MGATQRVAPKKRAKSSDSVRILAALCIVSMLMPVLATVGSVARARSASAVEARVAAILASTTVEQEQESQWCAWRRLIGIPCASES